MNEHSAGVAAGVADDVLAPRLLIDFPVVFLSYDEPWADSNWHILRRHVPHAVRVHGVKGLDASHKAAAAAVKGDWIVTVDADTTLLPGAARIEVPRELLGTLHRLDWLSRNRVNGLWSGNGSLKLWPRRILLDMRTHEAAPAERLSLDHGIGDVEPGRSGQQTMPERVVETNPARTEAHAFRAGFREAVFLWQMAAEDALRRGLPDWRHSGSARILRIWCCVGRHVPNGPWTLLGARLGLLWPTIEPGWDPRRVNDYDWLNDLWSRCVRPRFGGEGRGCRWDWLDADLRAAGRQIADTFDFAVAEIAPSVSALVAERAALSANAAASRHDALGYRMMIAPAADPEAVARARGYLEVARWLDHASAHVNIGAALLREASTAASRADAAWHVRAAAALGVPDAARRMEEMSLQGLALPEDAARPARRAEHYPALPARPRAMWKGAGSELIFRLDDGVYLGEGAARHVPDPSLCVMGRVLGYSARCELTGRILPAAIRFGPAAALSGGRSGARVLPLPVVLGHRLPPVSARQARAFAAMDVASGIVDPAFAGLGSHGAFGAAYVETVRACLAGGGGDAPEFDAEASAFLASVLPAVAPPSHWYEAAQQIGAEAAALRRTAEAVWGSPT